MKKLFFAFSFVAMGMMNNAYAQDDVIEGLDDLNLVANVTDTLAENLPNDFVKVDTIDYLSDQIQNIFIGANIGLSLSMGENTRYGNFFDMSLPSYQFTLGKWFYPQFGLRAVFQYLNQKGRVNWEVAEHLDQYGAYDGNYDFSLLTGFVDGLINFHNTFWRYKEDRRFNLIGYFGLGAFYTVGFDKDKLNYLRKPWYKSGMTEDDVRAHWFGQNPKLEKTPTGEYYMSPWTHYGIDGESSWYFAGHVGLIANYMITDAFDINVDISFNGTDDGYNGVRFRRVYDSYVNVMAGLTFHIQDRSGKRRLRYSHYTDQNVVTVINRQLYDTQDSLENLMKPVVRLEENVAYNEMLQTVVSFYIDKTFVTDAQKRNVRSVARFMETHPELDVVVTGYADVQTAYPKYNMMLSQKRAKAVYDLLVNEYGVDPKRLSMDYKGDEEQPFEIVNEWNRAVVFVIKPHDDSFEPSVQDKAKDIKLNSHESGRLRQTGSQETRTAY